MICIDLLSVSLRLSILQTAEKMDSKFEFEIFIVTRSLRFRIFQQFPAEDILLGTESDEYLSRPERDKNRLSSKLKSNVIKFTFRSSLFFHLALERLINSKNKKKVSVSLIKMIRKKSDQQLAAYIKKSEKKATKTAKKIRRRANTCRRRKFTFS